MGLRHTKERSDMLDASNVTQLLPHFALGMGFPALPALDSVEPTEQLASWSQVPCEVVGKARRLLRVYILAASRKDCPKNSGRVDFEGPQSCSGWQLEELQSFITEERLYLAVCHACAFASPHKKPWRIATSCIGLQMP